MKENEENLINEILKDASPDNKKNNPKKGKSRIFHKKGASDKAFKDFRKLKPSDIKTIDSGYTGKLSDSCQVNVRTNSSGKIPTLEIIFNKFNRIKIRYH